MQNWWKWMTSLCKGFEGKRRVARCKGPSHICTFGECPYQEQYSCQNVQLERRGLYSGCFICRTPAEVDCPGVKILVYGKKIQ